MSAGVTIPQALTRTAADDRAEALNAVQPRIAKGEFPDNAAMKAAYDAALAAVLAEQAEAVFQATAPLAFHGFKAATIPWLAWQAAQMGRACCKVQPEEFSLSQRADMLQAARLLCKVALEVSA